jgi:hypothetical protein
MKSATGPAGNIIKRSRSSPLGFWSPRPGGEKKWTPAITLQQVRAGIAEILHQASHCGTPARIRREREQRLRRNELARPYHWNQRKQLALELASTSHETVEVSRRVKQRTLAA